MEKNTDRILTPAETAKRLTLSERTLDRLSATNSGLRKVQLSTRRIGYCESEVLAFIERAKGCPM